MNSIIYSSIVIYFVNLRRQAEKYWTFYNKSIMFIIQCDVKLKCIILKERDLYLPCIIKKEEEAKTI